MENNRLIAEFMGWKYTKSGRHASTSRTGKWCPYRLTDIKFDTSWDWLMPVVEKIESLGEIAFQINNNRTAIYSTHVPIIQSIGGTKIEAVYKSVVDFINWHNAQNHD